MEELGVLHNKLLLNVIIWMNNSFIFLRTKCLVSPQNDRGALQWLMNMSFFSLWSTQRRWILKAPFRASLTLPSTHKKAQQNPQKTKKTINDPAPFRSVSVPLQRRKDTPLELCVCNYFPRKETIADEPMSWRKAYLCKKGPLNAYCETGRHFDNSYT